MKSFLTKILFKNNNDKNLKNSKGSKVFKNSTKLSL